VAHAELTAAPFTARYLTRPPSERLAPFVESLWYFEGRGFSHERERILPSGTMQILVNLHEDELRSYHGEGHRELRRIRGAALAGIHPSHFAIDTAEQRAIAGVSFKPGGAFPFFDAPASATAGEHVELDFFWGRHGAVIRERLLERPTPLGVLEELEACLLERAARDLRPDLEVSFAVHELERGAPVRELTEELRTSPRRFIRRFEEVVGLTPKRYARIRRFRRVLDAIELGRRVDWAKMAVLAGYYDQAHLIHDFREFSGLSPGAYEPRTHGDRTHVPLRAR
jgi:AraC-like DNA-binding protein